MNNEPEAKKDVYEIVNTRIIEQLEQKIIPWRKPWTDAGVPRNLITKNAYRGINTWLLASAGFERNLFLTWQQVQDVGGKVKRGEKSQIVVYWQPPKSAASKEVKEIAEDETVTEEPNAEQPSEQQKSRPVLRYYIVFNIAQCEGIPEALIPKPIERPAAPIRNCDLIMECMPQKPVIQFKQHEAWYDVVTDIINMPKRKSFESSECYYATLFHELIHSTGHQSRLHRKELVAKSVFGSPTYSIEELCAEIGACYLKSIAGISDETFENSVSYIDGWLTQLKKNKKFIFYASGNAQKAVDFILNKQAEDKEEVPETELQTQSV